MTTLHYLGGVATVRVDGEACVGCGMCVDVCPRGVLALDAKVARIQDLDACIECGACARNCPVEAITVEAGVGCAAAFIKGALMGTKPCCGGDGKTPCCG
jgi:ferredoxin